MKRKISEAELMDIFPIQTIKTEGEYNLAMEVLDHCMELSNLGALSEKGEWYYNVLSSLIVAYEVPVGNEMERLRRQHLKEMLHDALHGLRMISEFDFDDPSMMRSIASMTIKLIAKDEKGEGR